MKTVVIIGANACGASTAARLRRLNEKIKIIVFDKGNYMSFANCGLPYYVGGEVKDIDAIDGANAQSFAELNNLNVYLNSEVVEVNTETQVVTVYDHQKAQYYHCEYDDLVLAMGGELKVPSNVDLQRDNVFQVLTINDAKQIDEYLKTHEVHNATIMGGGYIGLEMAEQLHQRNLELTIFTKDDQLLSFLDIEMANMIYKKLSEKGIRILLECIDPPSNPDMLIVATGVKPNSLLAKQIGMKLGEGEAIHVNEYLQTSFKNIWAGGDLIESKSLITGKLQHIPLAGPANRHGHIIAGNILGKKIKLKPSVAVSILKVFELTVATVGINEKTAHEMNYDYDVVYIHAKSHAGYFPGAKPLTLKIIFATSNYKILGAQIIGEDGVDKRIDVIAMAVQAGLKVTELDDIELAYAPPYGSARDPVNLAGMVAENIKTGLLKQIHWYEVADLNSHAVILDLRAMPDSIISAKCKVVEITFEKLRERFSELDKNRETILMCELGAKSYDAYRMLELHGFTDLKVLAGGMKIYSNATYLQKNSNSQNLFGKFPQRAMA